MVSVLCLAEASVRKSLVTCLFKGKDHMEETVTWVSSYTGDPFQSMRVSQAATPWGTTSPWRKTDLPKVITSGHRLYLEVLYHFFGTITFETTGYTL